MLTGPEVFLELLVACGLQPCGRTHLKNGLMPYSYAGGAYNKFSAPLVGERRIFPVGGAQSTVCCTVCSGVSHHWIYLWPHGDISPGFNPPRRGLGLSHGACGAPKKGMLTGLAAFLELPDCDRTHQKTVLCHTHALVGRMTNTARSFFLQRTTESFLNFGS